MVSIIKRKKGKRYYYYLRHNDGKTQKEIYLGIHIPKNIEQIKRDFYLDLLRHKWIGPLEIIAKQYSKLVKNFTKNEIQNNLEIFSFDFTHDTNKIEGSSLSRKETHNLLRFKLTPTNKPEWDMIETSNHHKAFIDMMRSKSDLSLKRILVLHKRIFAQTKPEFAGVTRKKRMIVVGSRSTFPHPSFVPALLKQFFLWYEKAKNTQNPVELAGLAHFRFVSIHPFADGNGRISRLITNGVLSKNGYPLLNIKFADRHKYYLALEKSQTESDEIHFLKWFVTYYIENNRKYLKSVARPSGIH